MKTVEKPDPSGSGCFSFITLGCKSNQYDSAAMASDLLQVGLRNADPADADIVFINTCMVTGPAEARCRKAIRHVRRTNPRAKLVVGGCMSRGAKDQLASLSQADLILDPALLIEKGVGRHLGASRPHHEASHQEADKKAADGPRFTVACPAGHRPEAGICRVDHA